MRLTPKATISSLVLLRDTVAPVVKDSLEESPITVDAIRMMNKP